MLDVKVKKVDQNAKLPTYATSGSACFDLYALSVNKSMDNGAILTKDNPVVCGTGLEFEIPEGFAMKIYSRSGHGFKNSVRLINCTGIIDSDYRAEVMVKLVCDMDGDGLEIKPGERVAQGEIVRVEQCSFIETDTLSETERGTGGFGSTGKN